MSIQDKSDYQALSSCTMALIGAVTWFLVSYFILINLILFLRFLKIKLTPKIGADGSKAILITGGTSGIGLLLAKFFHKIGFTVIVGYYCDKEPGYAELAEISRVAQERGDPERVKGDEGALSKKAPLLFLTYMDVRSEESVEKSHRDVCKFLDANNIKLHCLINNSGIARDGPYEWIACKNVVDVIDTNFRGALIVTRKFMHRIIKDKGRVVNVSSVLANFPGPTYSVYGATKAGLAYFTLALNEDIRKYGATCCCVLPGNLMRNTNIIFTRMDGIDLSERSLAPEERDFYAIEIENYRRDMTAVMKSRLRNIQDKPEADNVSKSTKRKKGFSNIRKIALWILCKLDGGARNTADHDKNIISSFEKAVCLKNAPFRIYCGNAMFENYFGPIQDFIPQILHDTVIVAISPLIRST